jgi:hypothetical protein
MVSSVNGVWAERKALVPMRDTRSREVARVAMALTGIRDLRLGERDACWKILRLQGKGKKAGRPHGTAVTSQNTSFGLD